AKATRAAPRRRRTSSARSAKGARASGAALERVVAEGRPAVIAVGGGIVAEPATFALLLDAYITVWQHASPEEHVRRMLEEGDTRPMRGARRAMNEGPARDPD